MHPTEQAELYGRLVALRALACDLRQGADLPPDLINVPPEHHGAVIDAVVRSLARAQLRLEDSSWSEVSAHLLYAEALLNVFKVMLAQRRAAPWSERLAYADRITGDAYTRVADQARVLRLPAPKHNPEWLPPLCRLQHRHAPAAQPTDTLQVSVSHDDPLRASLRVLGALSAARWSGLEDEVTLGMVVARTALAEQLVQARPWPFPVILLPLHQLEQPGRLVTLLHEVGVVLAHDLGLLDRLAHVLASDTRRLRQWERWSAWSEAILGDLLGLVLGGPAVAHAMAGLLIPRRHARPGTDAPGAATRIALLLAAARWLHLPLHGEGWLEEQVTAAAQRGEQRYIAEVDGLIRRLVAVPVGDGRLEQLLAQTAAPAAWGHLPGRVHIEVEEGRLSAEEAGATFDSWARALPRAPWQKEPAWYAHERGPALRLAPTHLALPGQLVKIPPVHLMVEHDEIDLVGITHWQLAAKLAEARERRGRCWKRIAVYFLADVSLHEVAVPGRGPNELALEKAHVLEELRELLGGGVAETVELREYRHPTLFASFWRTDGVLQRAHTSACVWGRDILQAPSIDYRRLPWGDNPELDELEAGLQVLRDELSWPIP
ncbi:MAG: hypothetical protein ABIO70_05770 [Pseudomonadota bacterium]